MLNFIIETGFRVLGIRHLETTRVYNSDIALLVCRIGIRNLETTRVYNYIRKKLIVNGGIRNLETTIIYES